MSLKEAFKPEGIVFHNGLYKPALEARVSIYDHGFLYGDGLFETMRAYNSRVFALTSHLQRLYGGLACLGFNLEEFPYTMPQLAEAIEKTVTINSLTEAYVRITVTRGEGPPGLDPELCFKPNVVIIARPVRALPPSERPVGIRSAIVPIRKPSPASLDPALKSLNYLPNIMAIMAARAVGAEEGILLNEQGFIAEGTVSNIFWIANKTVYTPSLGVGILPGITRDTVIEVAKDLGFDFQEGFYTISHLYSAEEIFFTNSGSELLPVGYIDGRPVGNGRPGKRTCHLWQKYREKVWHEIGSRLNRTEA
ncbi:branched-chain amino acid aminotransferase [Heliorestis acidaminivorans]|uniref:Branched-chain amino acid aminotransferase n=1 Tax=Heliorestis acidaminivorans TaxID=553427 RepID=A0A6I0F2S3_9FIRM|nr:aminotransferase class IV [Heliorestis acidaminivorans]KAB2953860.1 branched-chain amino acid aminotransferase [Heliorestis acidaminivorans]